MAGRFEVTTVIDRPIDEVWAEVSKNLVTASEGGYDLAPEGSGTRVTLYNVLEGHGFGKLLEGVALRGARKGAGDYGAAIKRAVEAS